MNISKKTIFILLSFFFLSEKMVAQNRPSFGNQSRDSVEILYSELLEYIMRGTEQVKKLKGNCRLRHSDAIVYCDSAIVDNNNNVLARGDVVIQQGDSLNIFADSVIYNGSKRVADLFGKEVILDNRDKKLFTKKLHYDLNTKVATYNTESTLVGERTQLTSQCGQYFVQQKEALFKDRVIVVDKDFSLKTDTLKFNTKDNIATFLAPTLIVQDTGRIYTEAGFYNISKGHAEFTRYPQYVSPTQNAQADTMRYEAEKKTFTLIGNAKTVNGTQQAEANTIRYNRATAETWLEGNAKFKDTAQNIVADTIRYNGKTKTFATRGRSTLQDKGQTLEADFVDFNSTDSLGMARGNVIFTDTTQKIQIRAQAADYDRRRDYLKAYGNRPILANIMEGDTLWLRADTIISMRDTSNKSDTVRILRGYYNVRMYKSDFQAVCDSLVFSERDSIFRLFRAPMIWSDTSQLSADTIRILLKDSKIDRLFLRQNAFIINSKDEQYFNQVKGRDCIAFFENNNIRRVQVEGNAESVYYATDEKEAYIGVNTVKCSEMMLFFGNNKVDRILFKAKPDGKMTPMRQANHEALKLKGFKWNTTKRPKSLKDL